MEAALSILKRKGEIYSVCVCLNASKKEPYKLDKKCINWIKPYKSATSSDISVHFLGFALVCLGAS